MSSFRPEEDTSVCLVCCCPRRSLSAACGSWSGGCFQERSVLREVVKWKAHPWYDFVVPACVQWCTHILTAVLPLRYVTCWAECCFIPTTCHVEPVIGNLLGYLCVDTARKGWKNCCCPEFLSSANYVVLSPIYLCVQLLHDCELCSK